MNIDLQINNLLKKVLKKKDRISYDKLNKILLRDSSNNKLRFNLAIIEENLGFTENAIK